MDKKLWYVYKMEMNLESTVLSEISQIEKTNTIGFHSYVESNEQNKLTKNRKRLIENRLTTVRGEGHCRVGGKDEGIKQRLIITLIDRQQVGDYQRESGR